MNATETIFKTTRFDMLPVGGSFTCELGPETYIKISAQKARRDDLQDSASHFKPSARVSVPDLDAMARRDAELAKPLFDGTRESCRTDREFYVLEHALREVVNATDRVDQMADYIAGKMADVKKAIERNGAVRLEKKDRWDAGFAIQPAAAASSYLGLNELGELQGNGNIDALIMALHAKRQSFALLVRALGYRLEADGVRS